MEKQGAKCDKNTKKNRFSCELSGDAVDAIFDIIHKYYDCGVSSKIAAIEYSLKYTVEHDLKLNVHPEGNLQTR